MLGEYIQSFTPALVHSPKALLEVGPCGPTPVDWTRVSVGGGCLWRSRSRCMIDRHVDFGPEASRFVPTFPTAWVWALLPPRCRICVGLCARPGGFSPRFHSRKKRREKKSPQRRFSPSAQAFYRHTLAVMESGGRACLAGVTSGTKVSWLGRAANGGTCRRIIFQMEIRQR